MSNNWYNSRATCKSSKFLIQTHGKRANAQRRESTFLKQSMVQLQPRGSTVTRPQCGVEKKINHRPNT